MRMLTPANFINSCNYFNNEIIPILMKANVPDEDIDVMIKMMVNVIFEEDIHNVSKAINKKINLNLP